MDKREKLLKKVRKAIGGRIGAHGLDHALRVRKIALELAKKEKADEEVVEAMALLHDLVREDKLDSEENLENTVKEASKILKECGYAKKQANKIIEGIRTHSLHSKASKPKSIEAKILFDADKIDAVGEIGLARAITVLGKMNLPMGKAAQIYLNAIKKFENQYQNHLHTKSSTQMILPKIKYSKEFMERVLSETTTAIGNKLE